MARRPPAARSYLCTLSLLIGASALADPSSPSQISTEVGYGYEAQSSPLVKLSPSGALLSIGH